MKVREMKTELTSLIVSRPVSRLSSLLTTYAGSPKYFGPILHYLRTNSIDIPSDYKLTSMRMEAEFYGIQKIIDHIDFLESEGKKREDGCMKGEENAYLQCPIPITHAHMHKQTTLC